MNTSTQTRTSTWRWIGAAIIIIIALVLFSTLRSDNESDITGKTLVPIGVSTILRGEFAGLGENVVKSAELVLEELNEKYTDSDYHFELAVEDAGWDTRGGISAARKLVTSDKVNYIIGGTNSNGTLAAAPFVNEEKVLYLTPLTGGNSIDQAGPYVFRTAHADILVGAAMVEEMLAMGIRSTGLVYETSEYSIDIIEDLKPALAAEGIATRFEFTFQPNESDMKTLAARVHGEEVESVVLISNSGVPSGIFLKDYFDQTNDEEMTPTFFTDFIFATNPRALALVNEEYRENIYFADPAYDADNPGTAEFIERYIDRYGESPLIPFHTLSTYDTMMLIAEAVNEVGDNPEQVRAWLLENVKNYRGLVGTYSLDEHGNSDLGFVMRDLE